MNPNPNFKEFGLLKIEWQNFTVKHNNCSQYFPSLILVWLSHSSVVLLYLFYYCNMLSDQENRKVYLG